VKKNQERLATLRATMRTVDDIVGNAHQSLTYFVYLASEQGSFNGEESQKFQEILQNTQERLAELRHLDGWWKKSLPRASI
jgi:hypothetical protein